jgi:transcriptional regulator with PAS, ATPase and Fis domain
MIDRRTKVTGALGPASALTRVDTSVVRLVVAEGVHKGEAVELKDDVELLLGADATCDLILTDPTVSREHARVSRTDGGVLVKDLGSTNGTYYERGRVREVVVPFGASINLGKQRIKIVPHETAVETAPSTAAKFGSLVGEDRRMRQMFSLLSDVAPTEATVVIEGETGTGKELVASALHQYSSRAKKPFVVFDCSAVPRDLIESSLFGHVKGSFTGATATRQGVFKRAHQGTIFLDEIGELPLDLQPKLLRALESRAVQMVGADDYQPVDVRVVAATNRNLKQEVRAGRFREDLYYRLAVVRIVLPPLRDRLDDLRTLISHFLTDDEGRRPVIAEESWAALRAYHWPGNVRELKNLAERAKSL